MSNKKPIEQTLTLYRVDSAQREGTILYPEDERDDALSIAQEVGGQCIELLYVLKADYLYADYTPQPHLDRCGCDECQAAQGDRQREEKRDRDMGL
jgi:hypothetical protein